VAEAVQTIDADSMANACEGEWIRILGQLKAEIGDNAFRSWLRPISLERVDDGQATIAAPTRFLRNWVATHYLDRLLALWQAENERMTRVSIIVAAPPGGRHAHDADEVEIVPLAPPISGAAAPLEIGEDIRRMVIEGRASSEMKSQDMKMGLLTLRRTGILNAMRGRTTLEEVIRMTMGD